MTADRIRESILPPVSTNPTRWPTNRSWWASSAASGAAPLPSATVFSIFEQHLHGVLKLVFAGQEDLADQFSNDRQRDLARCLDGDAVGNGPPAGSHLQALQRLVHRGEEGGLDAINFDLRPQRLGGD